MLPSHDPAKDRPTPSLDTSETQGRVSAQGTSSPTPRHPMASSQNPHQRREEDAREVAKQQTRTFYTLPFLARQAPFTPSAFEHPTEYYVRAADQRQQTQNAGLGPGSGQKKCRKSHSPAEAGENGITSAIPQDLRPGPPKAKPAMPKSILKNRIVTSVPPTSTAKPSPQNIQTVPPTNHPGARYPPQPTARSASQEALIAHTTDIYPSPSTAQSSCPETNSSSSTPPNHTQQSERPASSNPSRTNTTRTSVNRTPTKLPFPPSDSKNNAHETPLNPKNSTLQRSTPSTRHPTNTGPIARTTTSTLHARHKQNSSSEYHKALAAHHHKSLSTLLARNPSKLPFPYNVPPLLHHPLPPHPLPAAAATPPPCPHNPSHSTTESPSILPHKEWPWLEPHELNQPKRPSFLTRWGRKIWKVVKDGMRKVREDHGRRMRRPRGDVWLRHNDGDGYGRWRIDEEEERRSRRRREERVID